MTELVGRSVWRQDPTSELPEAHGCRIFMREPGKDPTSVLPEPPGCRILSGAELLSGAERRPRPHSRVAGRRSFAVAAGFVPNDQPHRRLHADPHPRPGQPAPTGPLCGVASARPGEVSSGRSVSTAQLTAGREARTATTARSSSLVGSRTSSIIPWRAGSSSPAASCELCWSSRPWLTSISSALRSINPSV
jgi:hypothetical protein